jgi:hypothetical protein
MQAYQVFHETKYLKEAHTVCDSIIFPRRIPAKNATNEGHHKRQSTTTPTSKTASASPSKSNNNRDLSSNSLHEKYHSKGPAEMAAMEFCFFKLSRYCDAPLQDMWRKRTVQCVEYSYNEWIELLDIVPTNTGGWFPYSLYEGMGCLVSLMWQLSVETPTYQMPLFSDGYYAATESLTRKDNSYLLTCDDVELYAPPPPPTSPPRIKRTQLRSMPARKSISPRMKTPISPTKQLMETSKSEEGLKEIENRRKLAEQKLIESRERRAAAEEQARLKREAKEADAKKTELESEKKRKLAEQRRKAQLETRKQLQLVARKKDQLKAQELAKFRELEAGKKKVEENGKRGALLMARKEAQERALARLKAKEEADRRNDELESKRKIKFEERRKAMIEADANRRKLMMVSLLVV